MSGYAARAISKAGNAHLRRIAVEAAWAYRHRPAVGKTLAARQRRSSTTVTAWTGRRDTGCISATHASWHAASANSRPSRLGRELFGIFWAIGVQVQREETLHCARPPEKIRESQGGDGAKRKQTVAVVARGKGQSSTEPCARLIRRTREASPRQLPMDYDHAVSTREYQSDQPSQFAAQATVCLRFQERST